MRRLARLLPYLAVFALLAMAGVYFYTSGPLSRRVGQLLTEQIQASTGRAASIGRIVLAPGRVVLHDVSLRNPDGSPFLSVPEVVVRGGQGGVLQTLTTLQQVRAIELHRPTARFVRLTQGGWNISDLLRKTHGKKHFTATIAVHDGTVTVVDMRRAGAATTLHRVELTAKAQASGVITFRGTAGSPVKAFTKAEAEGQYDATTGLTKVTRLHATDVDTVYVMGRLPKTKAVLVHGGKAEVWGALTIGKKQALGSFTPNLRATVRGAGVSFPWLRQPLTGVSGQLRVVGADLFVDRASARLVGAPVTARASLVPLLKPLVDADFVVAGLTVQQASALFPSLRLPSVFSLDSPARIAAKAHGKGADVTVRGRADIAAVRLGNLSWHEFSADFTYTRQRLVVTAMRAHGSPRKLEGDLRVDWGGAGGTHTEANLVLRDVPVQMLAGYVPDLATADLGGTATVTLKAAVNGGTGLTGEFVARDVRYRQHRLGEVRGRFSLADQVLHVTDGSLRGSMAKARFTLTTSLTGSFDLRADLLSLDLASLGLAGLAKRGAGTLQARGEARKGHATGHLALRLAEPQGVAARAISADLELSPKRLALTNLVVQSDAGPAKGELVVLDPGRPGARLSGRLALTDAPLRVWLPSLPRALPEARATGTVALTGPLGDPRLQVDVRLASVTLAEVGTGSGRLRLEYAHGAVRIDELALQNQGNRLVAQGGYSPARGLDLRVTEGESDLSVFTPWTEPLLGLALAGPVTISAAVQGALDSPDVDFRAVSPVAVAGGQPVQDLTVVGRIRGRLLTLEKASFRQGPGAVSVSGHEHLRTGEVQLSVAASDLNLASFSAWTRPHLGLAMEGPVSLRATVTGTTLNPQAEFQAAAGAVTVNDVAFRDLLFVGRLKDGRLNLDEVKVRQGEGGFAIVGAVDLRTQQLNLSTTVDHLDVYQAMLLFARAASRLSYFGSTDRPLLAYASMPAPLGGKISATALVTGGYDSPRLATDLALDQLSFSGGAIDHIGGNVVVSLQHGAVSAVSLDLSATEGEAFAAVRGDIVPGGEVTLRGDVNNFEAKLLEPWLHSAAGFGGKATINFDVSGTTGDPVLRGDVFVDNPSLGPVQFEALNASPIELRRGLLTVEEIHLRNGPMLARGRAAFPLLVTGQTPTAGAPAPPSAELHVTGGKLAPVKDMTPAEFDADFYLLGNRLVVQQSVTPGTPEASAPGVRGKIGRGSFSVSGDVAFPSFQLDDLTRAEYHLNLDLDPVDIVLPGFLSVKLSGQVQVRTAPGGGPIIETAEAHPLVISEGTIGVPPPTAPPLAAFSLPQPPQLRVRAVVGDKLLFHYATICDVEAVLRPASPGANPTGGYLDVGGTLDAQGITLHGEVESQRGRLKFPNTTLDLHKGRVALDRRAGGPLRVRIVEAQAEGQVGDYHLVLNPSGQVYPEATVDPGNAPLDLGAETTPYLDTPYVLALLVGPIITPPTVPGGSTFSSLSPSARSASGTATLTGLLLPGLGTQNVSLAYDFEGPLSVRLRELLFGRLYVQYFSPLSGPSETRQLAFTYQVTPRYSLGWSVNELDQSRWQIQAYLPF